MYTSLGLISGLFLLIAGWVVWPLPLHWSQALPSGDSPVGTVPMLNAWIIWWNAESLRHGWADYWNAPFFIPAPGTLSLSEPLCITTLLTPITAAFGSPVPTYNAYLVLSLVLNGVFSRRLLLAAGCSQTVAVVGGIMVLMHPLALQNLEAVQLVPLWSILWTLEMLLRWSANPLWANGLALGLATGVTFLICLHHALFLLIILFFVAWSVIPYRRWRACIPSGLLAFGLMLLLSLPIVLPMRHYQSQFDLSRSTAVVQALSAKPVDWLSCPSALWVDPASISEQEADFDLMPGPFRVILVAACWPWVWFRYRRATILLTAVFVSSFILSFGANLSFLGWRPWETLADSSSVLAMVRSPYRFAYFTQLAVLLLAALSADFLFRQLTARMREPGALARLLTVRWTRWLLLGSLLCALLLDVIPPRSHLTFPSTPQRRAAWVDFLANVEDTSAPVLCLPVADNISEQAQERETRWMMNAAMHRHPILNGYSGFIPETWNRLASRLRQGPMQAETLHAAIRLGAKYVVIRQDQWPYVDELKEVSHQLPFQLQTVFDDDLYLILRVQSDPPSQGTAMGQL